MTPRLDLETPAPTGPLPTAAQAEHDRLVAKARQALCEVPFTEPSHLTVPAATAITSALLALDLTLTELLRTSRQHENPEGTV